MSDQKEQSKKNGSVLYVLDTNVLLHDPLSIFNFGGRSVVGIPMVVLEELEKFKREASSRGKNARETVRYLDNLRKRGSLSKGVKLDNGAVLKILFTPEEFPLKPQLNVDLVDNEVLITAVTAIKEYSDVRFISKDLNARVKADVLGLVSEDYLKGHVPQDEFYKGWKSITVPVVQLKKEIPDELKILHEKRELIRNEYVLVSSQHNPHQYKVFRYIGGHRQFVLVEHHKLAWPLQARNPQQLMALDALLNPAIEFVTLLGPAGTGKTFLALLAGLHHVVSNDAYQKVLVSRPVVPLGPDIGYLPGDLQEKLHSWMQPIYDNIDVIVHSNVAGHHLQSVRNESNEIYHGKKKENKKRKPKHEQSTFASVEDLVNKGRLSLEAITYMRGRSIPYQYILIDEVQNLSPHEVKTLVSRVGQNSKIVLCGDPYQIDSPYLDFSSNGLVVSSDAFKGQELFSTVFLETSERSILSKLVSELM